MNSYKNFKFQIDDGIAIITLNNGQSKNSISPEFSAEFKTVCECDIKHNSKVRAVILQSSEKVFSVGGDLGVFSKHGKDLAPALQDMLGDFHLALTALSEADAPVIAKINGVAGGGGLSLVLACDLIYATPAAMFSMSYTAVGLSPDGGSSFFLPRAIGNKRAAEMMLLNPRIDAQQAYEWGMINEVVPADAIDAKVNAVAQQIAQGPTLAFSKVKHLLRASSSNNLINQLHLEGDSIVKSGATQDAQRAIAGFITKTPITFNGS